MSVPDKSSFVQRRQLFVERLADLTRGLGVGISACGCCSSPFLTDETLIWQSDVKISLPLSGEYKHDAGDELKWVADE